MSQKDLPPELVHPHPERLAPESPHFEAIVRSHAEAIEAGKPLYEDPASGLWVMTAATLWPRACCDNGCRHCPHIERK